VVVNKRAPTTAHANSSSSTAANTGVYITYQRKEDAQKAIEQVDGTNFEGKVIRATYGTTKYCSYFLKGQPCQNIGCQFLHENGEDAEAYLKEESRLYNQRSKDPTKTTFQNKKDETESGLPPTASWAKPTPISLNNNKQFPALGATPPVEEPDIVPTSLEQSSLSLRDDEIFGSSALDEGDAVVPTPAPLDLKLSGYALFPRYNGLFDPFGGDRLKNALLALVNGKSVVEQTPANNGKPKSRFERLFDGHPGMEQVLFSSL
jgi:hypothetical protein